MSSKPETAYYKAIHRQFARVGREPYHEKMNNPYRGGTWDMWYSGGGKNSRDLWVEYKWLPQLPKRETTMILPELSQLQLLWGAGRYEEGRHIATILGCPEGGVIYRDMAWEEELSPSQFRAQMLSKEQIARYIADWTMPA